MGPRLSIVVVAYNMARELPRTIRSLSPSMQRGIDAADYEIIIVDNGSTAAFDVAECRRWMPDLIVHRMADPTHSPVPAINAGLSLARGSLVGVFIDGARMASPGLLALALDAAKLHPRPAIGTISFHLGPDIQTKSILAGYDQSVEDELLERSGWEENPYRLFEISAFAGSSAGGWFQLPNETNSLFLTADHWRELGGYDPAFVTPGGGLANLDLWKRLVESAASQCIILLGEATFHQVHGGVATNAVVSKKQLFHDEYRAIRGTRFSKPEGEARYFGRFPPEALPSVARSLARAPAPPPAEPVARLVAAGRPFESRLPGTVINDVQQGVMRTAYRGVPFLKSPFDIALYLQLLHHLRPRTVIEIGTKHGGSALWFADMLDAHEIEGGQVVSVDIRPIAAFRDPRIRFLEGDANALGVPLTDALLAACPHPWLVIEDSSHFYAETTATLEFFHPRLAAGDYIVVEDGVVSQLPADKYGRYENGPNRAVADFLAAHAADYEIDVALCDRYGPNATYNPNGWLRRR